MPLLLQVELLGLVAFGIGLLLAKFIHYRRSRTWR